MANAYVTGDTLGGIQTVNPYQPNYAGNVDAYVAKLGPATSPQPTTLSFTAGSATMADFNDAAQVQAKLTTTSGATPVPGKTITFTLGSGPTCSAVTDATGTATCSLTPNQAAGTYTLMASFSGDSSFGPSSASMSFKVTTEETTTKFTQGSPTVLTNGTSATFSATLKEDGVTPIAGRTLTFTLGSGSATQSCSGTTDANGTASCTMVVNQPPGSNTVKASFAGDSFYRPSSDSERVAVQSQTTTLSFTAASATTADFHDAAQVQARLTRSSDGTPVPGKMITFTLGSGASAPTCSGVTDATGTATCSLTPNQVAATYTLTATFGGDSSFESSSTSTSFVVTKEETLTKFTLTSLTVLANGSSATFSATLKEDGVTPITGRTLTFTLGSGSGAQSCSGTTNASGTASCTIVVNQSLGPNTVKAAFAGDGFYQASSDTEAVIVFAFLGGAAGGSFVIGDLNAIAGNPVTFWGAQWANVNSLSGGPAPDAFKGFANQISTTLPVCEGRGPPGPETARIHPTAYRPSWP